MKFIRIFQTAILTCFTALSVFAQNQFTIERQLEWYDVPQKIYVDDPLIYKEMWSFKGAVMETEGDVFLPLFAEHFNISSYGDVEIEIFDAVYAPLSQSRQLLNLPVKAQITPQYTISTIKKNPSLDIYFIPIRKNGFNGDMKN